MADDLHVVAWRYECDEVWELCTQSEAAIAVVAKRIQGLGTPQRLLSDTEPTETVPA
jgi:hypothetical protein